MNERANEGIITIIKFKILQNSQRPWPVLLQDVVEEYKNTPHDVAGFTQLLLVYGMASCKSPTANIVLAVEDAISKVFRNYVDYHEWNKVIYDKKHTQSKFTASDHIHLEPAWRKKTIR